MAWIEELLSPTDMATFQPDYQMYEKLIKTDFVADNHKRYSNDPRIRNSPEKSVATQEAFA